MTGFPQPGVRARPDWSFAVSDGASCRWEGDELTFLGFALGGVRRSQPWLIDLKALTGALQEIYGPRFSLGDRDLVLQLAVDARAEGKRHLADVLADRLRFPHLGYFERASAVGTLSRTLGHGRKSGFNPRVSYEVALPPRLSVAFNPYHLPAGSPGGTGGQFASRGGATTVALTRRERDENLQRMKEAIDRRRDLPAAVRDATIEIFDAEGRGAIDSNSGAVAGITQIGLTQAKNLGTPGLQSVKSPSDLNKDQIVLVYNVLISDALKESGGSRRLDSFSDRRTAIAIADTVFAHGRARGSGMLAAAARDLLRNLAPEARDRIDPSRDLDTRSTIDVLETLSNHGLAQEVRTAIADRRRAWVQDKEDKIRGNARLSETENREKLRRYTGWRPRIARFE